MSNITGKFVTRYGIEKLFNEALKNSIGKSCKDLDIQIQVEETYIKVLIPKEIFDTFYEKNPLGNVDIFKEINSFVTYVTNHAITMAVKGKSDGDRIVRYFSFPYTLNYLIPR